MALIEELRSIAKTVDFHLGAGACAEGRAADEIERLQRRVALLETVIRHDLDPSDCSDETNRKVVEEIVQRQPGPPELSQMAPAPDGFQSRPLHPLAGLAAELSRSPELPRAPISVEVDQESPYAPAPLEPQPPPSITDPGFNPTADHHLAEVELHLQVALRRAARLNEAQQAERPLVPEAADVQPMAARTRPTLDEAGIPRTARMPSDSIYDDIGRKMESLLRPSDRKP